MFYDDIVFYEHAITSHLFSIPSRLQITQIWNSKQMFSITCLYSRVAYTRKTVNVIRWVLFIDLCVNRLFSQD